MWIFAIAVILSLGAIDTLIPLIIILILLVAAAGATRGFSIFNVFGMATLTGIGTGAKGSVVGKTALSLGLYFNRMFTGTGFPLKRFAMGVRSNIRKSGLARRAAEASLTGPVIKAPRGAVGATASRFDSSKKKLDSILEKPKVQSAVKWGKRAAAGAAIITIPLPYAIMKAPKLMARAGQKLGFGQNIEKGYGIDRKGLGTTEEGIKTYENLPGQVKNVKWYERVDKKGKTIKWFEEEQVGEKKKWNAKPMMSTSGLKAVGKDTLKIAGFVIAPPAMGAYLLNKGMRGRKKKTQEAIDELATKPSDRTVMVEGVGKERQTGMGAAREMARERAQKQERGEWSVGQELGYRWGVGREYRKAERGVARQNILEAAARKRAAKKGRGYTPPGGGGGTGGGGGGGAEDRGRSRFAEGAAARAEQKAQETEEGKNRAAANKLAAERRNAERRRRKQQGEEDKKKEGQE